MTIMCIKAPKYLAGFLKLVTKKGKTKERD